MDAGMIQQLIATLGFPIVISLYLLIYFRKSMDSLKASLDQMNIAQTKLIDVIQKLCENENKEPEK